MVDCADPDFSAVARWFADFRQQFRAGPVYLQLVLKIEAIASALAAASRVEKKNDKSDAEKRLKDSFDRTEDEGRIIELV